MTSNVDNVVGELIGDWGPWQRRAVILIYLCKIPSAWFMACIIFTAPIPKPGEVACLQPEMQSVSNAWTESFGQKESVPTDFCVQNGKNLEPCTTFQYNVPFETTVTKFDLVCSRSILVSTSQFFHLFGVLTGGILATKIMEHISPRVLMVRGMIVQIIVGCLTGLVSNYVLHMSFRCLASICCAQMYTAGHVIFTDITGNKYRTASIIFFEAFWSLGIIILPAITYIDPNWSNIFLMISLPTILYIPLWCFIPDTPMWFLRKGRIDDAVVIIKDAVAANNSKLSMSEPELRKHLMDQMTLNSNEQSAKWKSLWKERRSTVVQIVAIHIAWAACVTNYSGMLFNVKAFGRDNLSINTIALGIGEMIGMVVGYCLTVKCKRKWQYAGIFNVFAGAFASAGYFYPSELNPDLKVGLLMLTAVVPKIAVSCSQSILFTCTTELVKPEQRKVLLVSCVIWARICLLIAPYIGAEMDEHQLLPLSVFGLFSVIGGVATSSISITGTTVNNCIEEGLPNAPEKIFTVE